MAPSQGGADQLQVMASGFAKLMASQLATRVVTFSMNLMAARHLSPEAYGLSAVQFHLITTTILFLSREGFRRGGLRIQEQQAAGGEGHGVKAGGRRGASAAERVLRVSWLVLPIGAAVSAAVCGFVLLHSATHGGDPEYRWAVVAHGAAAMLELCAEPLYIISSTRLEFGRRAAIDTTAMLAKCGLTLALVLRGGLHPALVFAAGQLAFGAVVLGGYLAYAAQLRAQGELAVRSWRWDADDRTTLALVRLFSVQAAEKLLLAEGSKLALVGFESGYNQGVYGLVANLGSLVVRLLFTPVEDAAFTAFSRAGLGAKADPAGRAPLAQVLSVAVKAVSLLGLLAVTFGPWYAYVALRLVYGRRWADTEAPGVLGWYTGYLLLLAVNGITEAFVHGVLDPAALRSANAALVAFAAAHVVCSAALVRLGGATGLVLADSVNMALRIAYSMRFIRGYFSQVPGFTLAQLLPANGTLAACAVAAAALAASDRHFMRCGAALEASGFWRQAGPHVGVGAACLGLLLARMASGERATARQALQLRSSARGAAAAAAAPAAPAAPAAGEGGGGGGEGGGRRRPKGD